MSVFDDFASAYVETATWADVVGEPLDRNYRVSDFSPRARARMEDDCRIFFDANREACEYDPCRAGRDLWLTRQHHGAGFWDGDWPTGIGEELTVAAHKMGECSIYIGDDGKLEVYP